MSTPKLIQKSILAKGRHYYERHLQIVNSFFPISLTPKEIEFLSAFMNKTGDLANRNRFNTEFRKEVRKELNISYGGMSNYIDSLTEKKAIKKGEDKVLFINSMLFPNDEVQYYQFKLEKDEAL